MNSPDEQTDYLPIHPGDDERSRMSSAVLKSKPRRSMLLSLVVFGLTGSLIRMAHKMGPAWVLSTPKQQQAQDQAPPACETTTQNAMPVENAKPPEPAKSLVLDAAQSYLATGSLKARK